MPVLGTQARRRRLMEEILVRAVLQVGDERTVHRWLKAAQVEEIWLQSGLIALDATAVGTNGSGVVEVYQPRQALLHYIPVLPKHRMGVMPLPLGYLATQPVLL